MQSLQRLPAAATAEQSSLGTCALSGPRLFGDLDDFGYVDDLLSVNDSLLVVVDVLAPPFLKVVHRGSGTVVGEYGPRGEGPEEFQAPTSLFMSPAEQGVLTVYDFSNQRLSFLDVGEGAPWLSFRREVPFLVDVGLVGLQPGRGGYVGVGRFSDFTLLQVDSAGAEEVRLVTDPPFDSTDAGGSAGFARSLNDARLAGGERRVVVAYRMTAVLDLVDLETGTFRTISGPREVETRYEVSEDGLFMDDANEMAYVDVTASPRLIFALFDGRPRAARRQRDAGGPRAVHVFDWDGRYVAELSLDRGATAIGVSSDDRVLWTGVAEPYPRVAEWALPSLAGPHASPVTCMGTPEATPGD